MLKKEVRLRKQNKLNSLSLTLPLEITEKIGLKAGETLTVAYLESLSGIVFLFANSSPLKQAEDAAIRAYLEQALKGDAM